LEVSGQLHALGPDLDPDLDLDLGLAGLDDMEQ
jgi:hypothetical protein